MEIKLVKRAVRSQKYTILVPVEYFESLGYVENDVVDVDIIVKNGSENNIELIIPTIETVSDAEYQVITNEGHDAENNNDCVMIIPYNEIIPIDSVLYVRKKLYYSINGEIVEKDGKRFEIDIHTGKFKNSTSPKCLGKVKPQNITNYAKFV